MSTLKANSGGALLASAGHLCTTCCGPGGPGILTVQYTVDPPNDNVILNQWFLGDYVGWGLIDTPPGYGASSPHQTFSDGFIQRHTGWARDPNGVLDSMIVSVDILGAYNDGLWTDSVVVTCYATWVATTVGEGPCHLVVTYNGITQTFTTPSLPTHPLENTPVTNLVALITVYADGTYTINPP